MNSRCLELINLYNNLLSKKEGFYNSFRKIDKNNVKKLKNFIVDINKNISEISNVLLLSERVKFFVGLYKELGIELEDNIFNDVVIPEKPKEGNWSLLLIEPNLLANDVFKNFPFRRSDNIMVRTTNREEREKTGKAYAIWVENVEKPSIYYNGINLNVDGINNKNIGDLINNLKKNNIKTMTLKERLIFELSYYKETGGHLDDVDKCKNKETFEIIGNSSTICIESSINGFMIPLVSWYDRSININSAFDSDTDDSMFARVIVL